MNSRTVKQESKTLYSAENRNEKLSRLKASHIIKNQLRYNNSMTFLHTSVIYTFHT